MNYDQALIHIEQMSNDKFNRSKNAIRFYIYNWKTLVYQNLPKKYRVSTDDIAALEAIIGIYNSHNNLTWELQGNMDQTKKWIDGYFKELTKNKVLSMTSTSLKKYLWGKQKDKEHQINSIRKIPEKIADKPTKESKKMKKAEPPRSLNKSSSPTTRKAIKLNLGLVYLVLLAGGTLFLGIQGASLEMITYISLLTIIFSLYNNFRPYKYHKMLNIVFILISLFIMYYSFIFFLLILFSTCLKPTIKIVKNLSKN